MFAYSEGLFAMAPISLAAWKNATFRVNAFKQSQQIKALTQAFEQYDQRRTPARASNLQDAFNQWVNNAPNSELQAIGLPARQGLLETITAANVPAPRGAMSQNPVGWTHITHAQAKGGTFQADFGINPANAPIGPEVVGGGVVAPLTGIQIAKVNEAMARCRRATRLARDKLLTLRSLLVPRMRRHHNRLANEMLYRKWFGDFEANRFNKVLANFKLLASAFADRAPRIYDMRNYDFGRGCYAAVIPGHIAKNGQNRVTESVKMILGTAFFEAAKPVYRGGEKFSPQKSFAKSSDATVGTLVHEFSHATWHAVDCPEIKDNATGNKGTDFKIGYDANPGDTYGSSDDNDIQTSTRRGDILLARLHPDFAVVNADNYGQFAVDCISPPEDAPDLSDAFELLFGNE